jgi:hypothetical protein
VREVLLQCRDCGCQTSVTAGTIFQGNAGLAPAVRSFLSPVSRQTGVLYINAGDEPSIPERYPAISVATLPTRWSADATPLPHLRLGPRIQTPGNPVLFAPACQCTTSRFFCHWPVSEYLVIQALSGQ